MEINCIIQPINLCKYSDFDEITMNHIRSPLEELVRGIRG